MYVSYARAQYTPGFWESGAGREKQGNAFPFGSSYFLSFPRISLRFPSIFRKNFVDGFSGDRKPKRISLESLKRIRSIAACFRASPIRGTMGSRVTPHAA